MNYYPFHIGDFRSGTSNMGRLQRAIYREMIDICYDTERPLPLDLDELYDAIGVDTEEDRRIVDKLIRFKFVKMDDGYHHEVCDRVVAEYHAKAAVAKANGRLGGRPAGSKKNPKEPSGLSVGTVLEPIANPQETGSKPNQEPRTNNQSSGTKKQANGTRLHENWHPSTEETAFCKAERPDLKPSDVARRFYDYWIALPGSKGRKTDWTATWRNWVRNEKKGNEPPPLKKDWE